MHLKETRHDPPGDELVRTLLEAAPAALVVVDARSPLASLNGTDNQFIFTTMRYKKNPLVITGPGAGPAVTAAGILNDVLKLAGE